MSRKSKGALSLVEVTVTFGLAATLLLGLFSLESTTKLARNDTRQRDLAREAARGQLEQVLATEIVSIPYIYDLPGAPFTFPVEGLTPPTGQAAPGLVQLDTTTAPASPKLIKVIVQVRWRGDHGDERFELSTFVTDRG